MDLSSTSRILIPGRCTSLRSNAEAKQLMGKIVHVNCITNRCASNDEYPIIALSMHPIEQCFLKHNTIDDAIAWLRKNTKKVANELKTNGGFVPKKTILPGVVQREIVLCRPHATFAEPKYDYFPDIVSIIKEADDDDEIKSIITDCPGELVKLPDNNSDEFVKTQFETIDDVRALNDDSLNVRALNDDHPIVNVDNKVPISSGSVRDRALQYPVPDHITDAAIDVGWQIKSDYYIESEALANEAMLSESGNLLMADRPPGNIDFGIALHCK